MSCETCTACGGENGHRRLVCGEADTALLEACREALGRRNMGCCGELSANWCLVCQDEILVLARLNERLGVPPGSASPESGRALSAER